MARNKKQVSEQQEQVATVAAVVEKPVVEKRGKSSLQSPVATTWALAHNMCAAARAAGQPAPSRKALVDAAIAAGITYYTARTQVQAYLKASQNGTSIPTKLPRGLTLGSAE